MNNTDEVTSLKKKDSEKELLIWKLEFDCLALNGKLAILKDLNCSTQTNQNMEQEVTIRDLHREIDVLQGLVSIKEINEKDLVDKIGELEKKLEGTMESARQLKVQRATLQKITFQKEEAEQRLQERYAQVEELERQKALTEEEHKENLSILLNEITDREEAYQNLEKANLMLVRQMGEMEKNILYLDEKMSHLKKELENKVFSEANIRKQFLDMEKAVKEWQLLDEHQKEQFTKLEHTLQCSILGLKKQLDEKDESVRGHMKFITCTTNDNNSKVQHRFSEDPNKNKSQCSQETNMMQILGQKGRLSNNFHTMTENVTALQEQVRLYKEKQMEFEDQNESLKSLLMKVQKENKALQEEVFQRDSLISMKTDAECSYQAQIRNLELQLKTKEATLYECDAELDGTQHELCDELNQWKKKCSDNEEQDKENKSKLHLMNGLVINMENEVTQLKLSLSQKEKELQECNTLKNKGMSFLTLDYNRVVVQLQNKMTSLQRENEKMDTSLRNNTKKLESTGENLRKVVNELEEKQHALKKIENVLQLSAKAIEGQLFEKVLFVKAMEAKLMEQTQATDYYVLAETQQNAKEVNSVRVQKLNSNPNQKMVEEEEGDERGGARVQQEGSEIGRETFNRQMKELEMSEEKLRDTVNKYMASDAVLKKRIKELEQSEKKLLETVEQLNGDLYFLQNVNSRIKGRLQDLQEELQEVNQEKEKSERAFKEKARRLQDHLRMKEGEIKSYLEYFEHYKSKRRQQLRMLREREHRLQSQVLKLEKELVDHNTRSSPLITEPEVISDPSPLHSRDPNVAATNEDQVKSCILTEDGEAHLKSQIQKLQHDLKAFLAREEVNNAEKEELVKRLQQTEENEDYLNRKSEEFRCRISELKLTEFNLQQRVEDLEENLNLQNQLKINCQSKAEEISFKDAEGSKRQHAVDANMIKHHGTRSPVQDELSILLKSTFNHLKHGKELLSSLKNANAEVLAEEPTKELKKDSIAQKNIDHMPVYLKDSYYHDIKRSNSPSRKPDFLYFLNKAGHVSDEPTSDNRDICKAAVANNNYAKNNTTSKPCLNTNPLLQSDSHGLYSAPLKDSILNLELEIVNLQAEKHEQKKLLQASDELVQRTSMQKYHLQTCLQEANQLLYMWALRSKQVWGVGTNESDQTNIAMHEQDLKELSNNTDQMTVRFNDQCMKEDSFFQEMYVLENGMTGISQDMSSANESGLGSSISSISHMDQGFLQESLNFESDRSQFKDTTNLDNQADTWYLQQEMERPSIKELPCDCIWTKERTDPWCHIASTVKTGFQPEYQHNSNLHIYKGNNIMRQLMPMEENNVSLLGEPIEKQNNLENISKRTLDEEADIYLLKMCGLEKQLSRYSQQVSALYQEKDSDQQKINSHDKSYPKYTPVQIPVSSTQRINAFEKEMESISEKIENLQQAKQNYLQKAYSMEQTHSKAIKELSELTEEKHKFAEKVNALEKEVEIYAQRVLRLDQENTSNSRLITSLNEQLTKIPLLEKEKNKYFEKAITVEKENSEFSQKITQLQKENEKYAEKICLLEEERARHVQVTSTLGEQNRACSQTVSDLEKDIATYSQKICRIEHENIMFLEKFHTLEEDIDRCYQKIWVSYETHSEYKPMLSTSTLGKLAAKYLTKTDLSSIVQNTHATCKMRADKSSSFKHTLPDPDQEKNDNMKKSEAKVKIEGFSLENSFQKIFLIEQKKLEFFQLISDLAEERNSFSQQISELLQDKDMAMKKLHQMEEEKVKSEQKIDELEADKETLLKSVESLHAKKEKHLKEMSKLQEDKEKCCQELVEQRKGNSKLRNKIDRVRKEASEKIETSKEVVGCFVLENKDLKELVVHLKSTYENVMKDTMAGMEEMVKGLEAENEILLDRIHQMETGAASEVNTHVEQMLKEREQLINRIEELKTEARTRENENQNTQPPNTNKVTMKSYFTVDEEAIVEQAIFINTNNSKSISDSKIVVGDLDTKNNVVVNELQEIKVQGNSHQTEPDNDPLQEKILYIVSECPDPLLVNVGKQQIQTQVNDEALQTLHQENECLKMKLEEARKELMELKQHLYQKPKETSHICGKTTEYEDTRYAEVKVQFAQALAEFENLKQHVGDAVLKHQGFKIMRGDSAGKTADDEMFAGSLKARLASLIQECQDRNGLITQLVRELQRLTNCQPEGDAGDMLNCTELAQAAGPARSPGAEEVCSQAPSDSIIRMNAHRTSSVPSILNDFVQQLLRNTFNAQTPKISVRAKHTGQRDQTTTLEEEGHQHVGVFLQAERCPSSFVTSACLPGTEKAVSVFATPATSHLPDVLAAANLDSRPPAAEIPTVVEKLKAYRMNQGSPAAVESVYIIKAVGKFSLMIGWGRPSVDELGCSNGIFIKGYRIYIDGQFHKCIMSSACTKTMLENLDLSVPFEVSVQTIGDNGLVSEKVHTNFNSCFATNKDLSSSTGSGNSEDQLSHCHSHST